VNVYWKQVIKKYKIVESTHKVIILIFA